MWSGGSGDRVFSVVQVQELLMMPRSQDALYRIVHGPSVTSTMGAGNAVQKYLEGANQI